MTQEEDDGVMATVKWLIRNQESGSESQCCPTMARSASWEYFPSKQRKLKYWPHSSQSGKNSKLGIKWIMVIFHLEDNVSSGNKSTLKHVTCMLIL